MHTRPIRRALNRCDSCQKRVDRLGGYIHQGDLLRNGDRSRGFTLLKSAGAVLTLGALLERPLDCGPHLVGAGKYPLRIEGRHRAGPAYAVPLVYTPPAIGPRLPGDSTARDRV